MRTRKLALGTKNMIGARVTQARRAKGTTQKQLMAQLQTAGVDISGPALSLLEGQKRPVSDIELATLALLLEVSPLWLLGWEEQEGEEACEVPDAAPDTGPPHP